ncbi:MAG: hypothetical protein AAGJ28_16185, partial [Pseudomonadota bacterium]
CEDHDMSDEVRKLKNRVKNANESLNTSLGRDLREAMRQKADPDNPNAADAEEIFDRTIDILMQNAIDDFNNIADTQAVRDSVDVISKSAASLKRESAKVSEIAKDVTKWSKRLDKSKNVVKQLKKFI